MKRLNRIKLGDEVKFTEDYLDFWNNDSFELCSIGGTLKGEQDALDYMMRKMLGLGYNYKAIVTFISAHTGEDPQTKESMPGYKVKVIFRHGLQFSTTVGMNNVSLFKKKKEVQL